MSQDPSSPLADEVDENQLIILDCDRIADVCNSFQGDLLGLIEENDRYREWNHGLNKALKKLKGEMAQLKHQKQPDVDGDFMKKYVDLKLEVSELMLTNQVLLQKIRRYEPETAVEHTSDSTFSPLSADIAVKNVLAEKTLECTKLEQEIVRIHAQHREQLKQAVEQVKEQSRKRNEELQARFNQQAVALKEDCVSIKNMIADRERAAKVDGEKALSLQKENQALRQELESRKLQERLRVEAISPRGTSALPSGEHDVYVLREALRTLQIAHTGHESTTDMVRLAVAGISGHEGTIKAQLDLLESQRVEVEKASKDLDLKAVRLNNKIGSFNASVIKWNKKQQEMRDKKVRKPVEDGDPLAP